MTSMISKAVVFGLACYLVAGATGADGTAGPSSRMGDGASLALLLLTFGATARGQDFLETMRQSWGSRRTIRQRSHADGEIRRLGLGPSIAAHATRELVPGGK